MAAFAILKAVLAALRGIPWWAWLAFTVLASGFAYGEWKESKGEDRVRAEWSASVERGKVELARRQAERAKITVKAETVYVDRIRVVREKGQTLIQRIPALVPADACLLPAGWRLSHDNAAAGTVPAAAARPDAIASHAESIAWRPWNSRDSAAGGDHGGRELQPVPSDSGAVASLAGMAAGAGSR